MSEQQPSSDIPRIARPKHPDELRLIDPAELSRYDLLLATIPLVLLAAWAVGQYADAPAWLALGAGSLAALLAIADGLAVNPPV